MTWGMVVLAALLFFLSHPNPIISDGLGVLGFVALAPVFVLVAHTRARTVWLYGFVYGALSYGLFCSWLASFHALTIYIVCVIYGIYLALLFAVLRLCYAIGGRLRFALMALAWLCYEFFKTKGFAGFDYGIMGYTQWKNPLLLPLASVGGVWLVSAACVLCGAAVAHAVQDCAGRDGRPVFAWRAVVRVACAAAVVLVAGGVSWLCMRAGSAGEGDTVRVIAVQGNTDPWKGGVEHYAEDIRALQQLTDEALEQSGGADLVVWPETAVVPPVVYHYQKRTDFDRYQLVLSVLQYVAERDACFVIGNQHTVDSGKKYTDDYNAALVLDKRSGNVIPPEPGVYAKQHLVPFTEWFPYGRQFPRLYEALLAGDTHLWTPGTDSVVFEERGVRFSVPICFEDTFPELCRQFAKDGAQLFVNISNDAWSQSLACQKQHLAMAVFRSAENAIPSVRSTASGMTCAIDRAGRVTVCAPPFSRQWICCQVPLGSSGPTLYTRFGDWFPWLAVMLAVVAGAICACRKRRRPVV